MRGLGPLRTLGPTPYLEQVNDMNTGSINRLITAHDYCEREGVKTVRERILRWHLKKQKKAKQPIAIQMNKMAPSPVKARIELGAVVGDCECGGCEFVSIEEPIFYCMECFNRLHGGALRPVQFPAPEVWAEIVRLVMLRPVEDLRGADDCDRAYNSRAVIYLEKEDGQHLPLTRSWNPNESVDDLMRENEAVEKWALAQLKEGA